MASKSNFVQAAIPRFDGHYDHWSMLMENFLRSKEYWPIVEDGIKAPAVGETLTDAQKTQFEARKLKDLKAKNYLFQAIERPILETILCKETSKDIWDSMKKKYQGSTRVKQAQLQALRRDFETWQMKEGESVTNYCARTMEICNKMRFHGENMGDVVTVEKILRSLTPKYDYVVCSIEESKDIDVLSLDELQSSLSVHEQKMNRSSTSDEQALKASTFISSSNSRGKGRGRGRGRGRGVRGGRDSYRNFKANNDQSQGKGRGRDYDKSKIECYKCRKFGHYASECYTRLPNDKEKEEKSNYAENKEGETLLMAIQVEKETERDV
uniref:CCHC-type domain-containing protein n=1 Tax=Nicotiana tabacum TaxID=4097 RepID=A0A1S4CI38_TOBAC